jgi:hypothetical protein
MITGIALTAAELNFTWHELGLGRMPYPLTTPGGPGQHGDEDAWQRLRDRGLWDVTPHPDLIARLTVLANPVAAVDAIGHFGGPFRALACTAVNAAALAVFGPDGYVRLSWIRPTALAASIVDIVPAAPPGYGTSVSARLGQAATAGELLGARVAGGQLGGTVTDRLGTRRRASTLVAWFDTAWGRYLMVRDDEWLSLAPTDNHRIAHRVDEILTATTRPVACVPPA